MLASTDMLSMSSIPNMSSWSRDAVTKLYSAAQFVFDRPSVLAALPATWLRGQS